MKTEEKKEKSFFPRIPVWGTEAPWNSQKEETL